MLPKGSGGEEIAKYCILDRDYHTSDEIGERYRSAAEHRIGLHIWKKKEIGNFVICPASMARYINNQRRKGKNSPGPQVEQVLQRNIQSVK